jgi:hypothetical protein
MINTNYVHVACPGCRASMLMPRETIATWTTEDFLQHGLSWVRHSDTWLYCSMTCTSKGLPKQIKSRVIAHVDFQRGRTYDCDYQTGLYDSLSGLENRGIKDMYQEGYKDGEQIRELAVRLDTKGGLGSA